MNNDVLTRDTNTSSLSGDVNAYLKYKRERSRVKNQKDLEAEVNNLRKDCAELKQLFTDFIQNKR